VPIVNATLFRSLSLRGLLAVAAAVLVRCSPEVAQCIARPGSSIYLAAPKADPSQAGSTVSAGTRPALRGRAALPSFSQALLRALDRRPETTSA